MPRLPVAAALAALSLCPVAAQALPPRQTDITWACAPDIERFCPTLSGLAEPRNQRICLRPYHTSLTPQCRRLLKRLP